MQFPFLKQEHKGWKWIKTVWPTPFPKCDILWHILRFFLNCNRWMVSVTQDGISTFEIFCIPLGKVVFHFIEEMNDKQTNKKVKEGDIWVSVCVSVSMLMSLSVSSFYTKFFYPRTVSKFFGPHFQISGTTSYNIITINLGIPNTEKGTPGKMS